MGIFWKYTLLYIWASDFKLNEHIKSETHIGSLTYKEGLNRNSKNMVTVLVAQSKRNTFLLFPVAKSIYHIFLLNGTVAV